MPDTEEWRELSESLDELLARGAAEQQSFLAALEKLKPAIASRLRTMLAARDAMEHVGFLQDPALPLEARPTTESALIGAQIGAWTIESEIGRGGMGSVWRARRSDGRFDGFAAIKFLHVGSLGREGEQRFRREGQLLGQLSHPNISRLIDAGVHPVSLQPYLVMEYVDGRPIDDWCDSKRLGVRERIGLFLRVLDAVAHAHSHLIIHRDLKPSNILVDDAGSVKLLDFGIAKLANENDPAAQTRSSVSALTPLFAAPEQLLGDPVTTRTDVYALGLVLYRLLTGRHAFHNEARNQNWAELRERDAPLMSSTTDGRPGDPAALRGDLDTIVAKALHREPDLRFGTVAGFGDDLIRYLRNEPITARPDTVAYRTSKFIRRHSGAVAVGAVAILSLIVAAVISTAQMLEASRQRDVAVLETRRAEASADFLQLVLSENRYANQALTTDELLSRSVNLLEQQYADDPAFRARMLLALATERASRREYSKSFGLMQSASEAARASGDLDLQAQTDCTISFHHSGNSEFAAAQASLDSARNKLTGPASSRWETDVQCLRAEANIVAGQPEGGRAASDRALALLTQARKRMEDARVTHRRDYTAVLSHLAVVHRGRGDIAQAFELVQLGGRIHEQNGRGQTRSRLIALNNEAIMQVQLGEYRAAFATFEALEARVSRLEPSSRNMVNFAMNYIVAAVRMGGTARTNALARVPTVLADAHARGDVMLEIDARTTLLAAQLDETAPLEQIDASIAALQELWDAPGRSTQQEYRIIALRSLVRRDLLVNDAAAAETRVSQWMRDLSAQENYRLLAEVMLVAASLSFDTGNFPRAIAEGDRARELAERLARGPDTSGRVGDALMISAQAHAALGQKREAHALATRALRCLTNGYGSEHDRTIHARQLLARVAQS